MIYLDNAATTPLTPSVIDAMTEIMVNDFGNPSSIHGIGRQANQRLRSNRQMIASSLKTDPRRIIFTSGATESNNTAIKGYALANQAKGKHLITTAIEHHSVLHTMAYLKKRFGFEVTYLKPENGHISAQQVADALRDDTILVSIMFANNETGDLLPVKEIGELLQDHKAAFHVDAVQAVGKIDVFPEEIKADFLSASAHKFHGPKGVGILYSTPQHFDNLLHGGEQEEKRRASTENMIGITGLTQALSDAVAHKDENYQHVQELRQAFLDGISSLDYYINGSQHKMPHVLNIGFPNQNNGILLAQLDLAGFAVSTGSACTAGTVDPSHVLSSIYGDDSPRLTESIRISFSELNTISEVQQLAKKLIEILGKSDGI